MSELSPYEYFIHQSRYARWLDGEERRETFAESCRRYADFWLNKELVTEEEAVDLYHGSVVAQHSAMVYQLKMDSRLVGAVLRGIEDDKYGISLYVLHTLCLGLARIH